MQPILDVKDIEELFRQLNVAGMKAEWCDTPIPKYDNAVQAGLPSDAGDPDLDDYILVPKSLLRGQCVIRLNVRGESMEDCGIKHGDNISVELTDGISGVRDGDTVVARVDGEWTVKNFLRREDGSIWLIPQNRNFRPIHLTEDMNCRIWGRVIEINKSVPHASIASMNRVLAEEERANRVPSERMQRDAIRGIAPKVSNGRLWFGVFRTFVDTGAMKADDYADFEKLVRQTVPEHKRLPKAEDLRRVCLEGFTKPLSFWRESTAPVKGAHFLKYKNIAEETLNRLLGDF